MTGRTGLSDARVVLAEYFVTEEYVLLFIGREDLQSPEAFEIDLPPQVLRRSVFENFGARGATNLAGPRSPVGWQPRLSGLVEPLLSYSSEGDVIWFVPHDVLHYVPLHALLAGEKCLIERNSVCYTPSASVMQYCQGKRKGRRNRALVLGDSLEDLPQAREEARIVAKLFRVEPYLGGDATKEVVEEGLSQRRDDLDVLHFSCHGEFDPIEPLRSRLLLAPHQNGTTGDTPDLTAGEIFDLDMRADLVTLSACESGINEYRPGDELIGLTRSLIYAGTPSVLVSLWRVNDFSTRLLMERFYRGLLGKSGCDRRETKAEALRAAQRYVMNISMQEGLEICQQRTDQARETENPLQLAVARSDEAEIRALGSDAEAAAAIYADVLESLEQIRSKAADALSTQISGKVAALERSGENPPALNHNFRIFAHPYFWSPFVLIGDWA